MGVMNDDHRVTIAGTEVAVTGETGLIEATWKLLIAGEIADSAKVTGDHVLNGRLSDGSTVEAKIHQGAFGPTRSKCHTTGNTSCGSPGSCSERDPPTQTSTSTIFAASTTSESSRSC